MSKEGAILTGNRISEFCIIKAGKQFFVAATSGPNRGEVRQGTVLRLSKNNSFLVKNSKERVDLSSSSAPLDKMHSFIVETTNSTYLVLFNPLTGIFEVTKRSGSSEGLSIGKSLYPAYLVFKENGTLGLYNSQGNGIYVTSEINRILAT